MLAIGNAVPQEPGAVFARLDNGPGVFILAAATAGDLNRDHLGFVDRTIFKFDAGTVTSLKHGWTVKSFNLRSKMAGSC